MYSRCFEQEVGLFDVKLFLKFSFIASFCRDCNKTIFTLTGSKKHTKCFAEPPQAFESRLRKSSFRIRSYKQSPNINNTIALNSKKPTLTFAVKTSCWTAKILHKLKQAAFVVRTAKKIKLFVCTNPKELTTVKGHSIPHLCTTQLPSNVSVYLCQFVAINELSTCLQSTEFFFGTCNTFSLHL